MKATISVNSTPLHFEYTGLIKLMLLLTKRSEIISCYVDVVHYRDLSYDRTLCMRWNMTLGDEVKVEFTSEEKWRSDLETIWFIDPNLSTTFKKSAS